MSSIHEMIVRFHMPLLLILILGYLFWTPINNALSKAKNSLVSIEEKIEDVAMEDAVNVSFKLDSLQSLLIYHRDSLTQEDIQKINELIANYYAVQAINKAHELTNYISDGKQRFIRVKELLFGKKDEDVE
jgi:hypothetical protein